MITTLHRYLWRDIIRASLLSLVVFTLVLTVFAIMEPLRKEGLSGQQVVSLFVYTVPMMLSLTLPIAALFGTSIVYGRFSQDNELLASNASGIGTVTILRPAITLGVVVTILSWVLSNYVTPVMALNAEECVKANIRQIAYNKLASEKSLAASKFLVHADEVDTETDTIRGIVVIDIKKEQELLASQANPNPNLFRHPPIFATKEAWANFTSDEELQDSYATFELDNPVLIDGESIRLQRTGPIESIPIPRKNKKKPAWYSWQELLGTLADPTQDPRIRPRLVELKRRYVQYVFSHTYAQRLNGAGSTLKLKRDDITYVLQTPTAQPAPKGVIRLEREGKQRIDVTAMRNGTPVQVIRAESGKIRAEWSRRNNKFQVLLSLEQGVVVEDLVTPEMAELTKREWSQGQFSLPADIIAKSNETDIKTLYQKGAHLTDSPEILGPLNHIHEQLVPKLRNNIIAEMHARVAYSISCTALVMIGAALGLIFRGGQVVSAFATSIIPAMVVITMIKMGTRLVKNPDTSVTVGLGVIWGGVGLILLTTVVIYLRLARR